MMNSLVYGIRRKTPSHGTLGSANQRATVPDDHARICVLGQHAPAVGGLLGVFVPYSIPQHATNASTRITRNQHASVRMPQQRNMPGRVPRGVDDLEIGSNMSAVMGFWPYLRRCVCGVLIWLCLEAPLQEVERRGELEWLSH
jgi:hypothetical protein